MNLKISEILKVTGGRIFLTGCKQDILESNIIGISTDSRKLKKGEMFIALRGDRFDGNNFVFEAMKKGAIGVIISKTKDRRPKTKDHSSLTTHHFIIQVPDTLKILGDIAKYYRSKFNTPLVAITGSCGKTTTKEMTSAFLSTKFKVLRTKKNYNNLIGLPLTLFNINDKHDVAVVEMGMSHAGEIKRLAEIARPNIAVITNIGKAHRGFFNSLEDIARAKSEIFKISPQPKISILNRDDQFFSYFASKTKGEIITFGINKKSDFRAEKITFDSFGRASFILNGKVKIKTSFPGRGNIYNILTSLAIAFSMGVEIKQSVSTLPKIQLLSGRTNFYKVNGVHVLDDTYNANPLSFINLLEIIEKVRIKGKKILVLGDMLELGKNAQKEHIKVGKLISDSSIDILIAVGTETQLTAENISANKKAWHFHDKHEAEKKLKSLLSKGDLLAVKGSRSMGMEKFCRF
ncbi:UDP-N-acetylmuramoyl-tripeptide--D-alanyl-D-alanine ligase [bacterium]|nr:UDP-N-acetylmuramoyl-tripeptide--D-alanyl-D-alanine ligase [bacterium]